MRNAVIALMLLASCRASEPRTKSESASAVTIERISGTNPITVRGVAHSAGSLVINVRDSRGGLLETMPVAPVTDASVSNGTFENRIFLTREPGPRVTIEVVDLALSDHRTLTSANAEVSTAVVPRVLFFPNMVLSGERCDQVFVVERRIPQGEAIATVLLSALVQGPTVDEAAAGHSSPFPPGTRVRSVRSDSGVVTVDFDEKMQRVGVGCRAEAIRAAVEQTLLALPGVRKVVITAGGREALALQP